MVGNIFYGMIFVSVIGSLFCVLSLCIERILRCALPLWFALCGMLLFCIPFLSPDVSFLSPEPQEWYHGFTIACRVWVCGCGALFLYEGVRTLLAKRAMREYQPCDDAHIHALCKHCAETVGLKKAPALRWATLQSPVCVTGVFRPAILMDRAVMEKLTDTELSAVLFHELTHIKRKHILWERIYQYICLLHWPNPFVWAARRDFSLHCETDCDRNALRFSRGELTGAAYAAAVIRLLELSSVRAAGPGQGPGALDFAWTKHRIRQIITKPSAVWDRVLAAALAAAVVLTVAFSMQFSREHFYPYPAYATGIEYGTGHDL